MPRRSRFANGGHVFHVLNRASARREIFADDDDYAAFLRIMQSAGRRVSMRLLAYCLMPNHWHLVVWPRGDDDLSEYMRWLTVTHTQRWHTVHNTVGTGPLYQGRFKSFPVEADDHFYRVCRYVERNALRANLVPRAESWRWSSLWQTTNENHEVELAEWPLPRFAEWTAQVNLPETEGELASVRASMKKGRPFGNADWQSATAASLGLQATLSS